MKPIKSSAEYREIILEIMKYIEDISRKNDINCFLSGGTLLGAIRHKGFIPWDDDADMMLLREDYEKLVKLINKDDSPYRALSWKNEADYFLPFVKVVDTRTYAKAQHVPFKNDGACVDLFPIDSLTGSKDKVSKYFAWHKKLADKYNTLYGVNPDTLSNPILLWMYRMILKSICILRDVRAAMNTKCSLKSKRVACSVWGYGEKEIIHRKYMTDAVTVSFEGNEFRAPIGYDKYLSNLYGDYMTPPPKTKQHNEHQARVWWR